MPSSRQRTASLRADFLDGEGEYLGNEPTRMESPQQNAKKITDVPPKADLEFTSALKHLLSITTCQKA